LDKFGLITNIDKDCNELGNYNPRTALQFELGSNNPLDPATLTFTSAVVVSGDQQVTFVSANVAYTYDVKKSILYDLKANQGSTAWFICGDKLQYDVPTSTKGLATVCAMNGYQWEYDFKDIYFFKNEDMEVFATTSEDALDMCDQDQTVTEMCNRVSDLPPYLCTRQVREAIVTYLGAAAGFANLVYTCLVVFGSISLSICYPLKSKKDIYYQSDKAELLINDEDVVSLGGNVEEGTINHHATKGIVFSSLRVAEYNRMSQDDMVQRIKQQDEMIHSLNQRLMNQEARMMQVVKDMTEMKATMSAERGGGGTLEKISEYSHRRGCSLGSGARSTSVPY
jgi:hypothetical protein